MESETVNNFDALLDQVLNDLAVSQGKAPTKDKQKEYQEYASFLQEISNEDEELAKAEISAVACFEEDKADGETNELLDELKDNPDNWFNKSSWVVNDKGQFVRRYGEELFDDSENIVSAVSNVDEVSVLSDEEKKELRIKKLQEGKARYNRERELRKINITRMAFDQTVLPLSERIPVEHKRLVIELLTEPLRILLRRYESYINNRITKLLAPAIPTSIKLAAAKWPWIFVRNPGFLYKTSSHFGEPKTFWVTPKVPYYFKQGTEQAILEERDASLSPYFLDCIDRAIVHWYSTRDKLAEREVHYASKMISIKGNTYYHLLELNPFWFEKLYNHIKKQKDDTQRTDRYGSKP